MEVSDGSKTSVPRQGPNKIITTRPSRPTLTVDTNDISKHTPDEANAQSAPVGTRQERGIPPMYQAVDRHCAKLTEIMNSPTWRNQNPGPHIAMGVTIRSPNFSMDSDHVLSPLPSDPEHISYTHSYKANKSQASEVSAQAAQALCSAQPVDAIHLSHDSQAIKIFSIDRFPDTPETLNAYIISATVPLRPQNALSGGLQATRTQRSSAQRKTAQDSCDLEDGWKDGEFSDHEQNAQDSVRGPPNDAHAAWAAVAQQHDDHAMKILEQDQAIESVNHHLQSAHRHSKASPDEKQRFRGLLDRLHDQYSAQENRSHEQYLAQENPVKAASFVDPAIISSLPKRIGQDTPTKRSKRNRSDSAYSSLPDNVDSGFLDFQNEKDGSGDSELDSPSKHSTLNPAAKDFLSMASRKAFPAQRGEAHPILSQQLFLAHQKDRGLVTSLEPSQFSIPSHQTTGSWYPSLSSISPPMMSLPPMQQAPFQYHPGTSPYLDNCTGGVMPLPSGINPPCPSHSFSSLPGFDPGMVSLSGLGLGGVISPPSHVASSLTGAFHHQLPNLSSCNNPAHGSVGVFNPQDPSSPSASMPQNGALAMPLAPSNFIPKHVPKPKVPNTAGQQNWELMHELRRTMEPGYAQKCKEKQKKRFMKQLEKGSTSHS